MTEHEAIVKIAEKYQCESDPDVVAEEAIAAHDLSLFGEVVIGYIWETLGLDDDAPPCEAISEINRLKAIESKTMINEVLNNQPNNHQIGSVSLSINQRDYKSSSQIVEAL